MNIFSPSREQTMVSIHRLWLQGGKAAQQLFSLSSSLMNSSMQSVQHFTNITSSWSNPILSIFTDKQLVFLDQRKLQMINYSFTQNTATSKVKGKLAPSSIDEEEIYCVNSISHSIDGTKMYCLFDSQELYSFTFPEDYQLDRIQSQQYKCSNLPMSGIIIYADPASQKILILNQTGYSSQVYFDLTNDNEATAEDYNLSQWSTNSSSLILNIGPVIDFKVSYNIYCVAGLPPCSALYEVRKGITTRDDISETVIGSLDFEYEIDQLWLFANTHMFIKFYNGL